MLHFKPELYRQLLSLHAQTPVTIGGGGGGALSHYYKKTVVW